MDGGRLALVDFTISYSRDARCLRESDKGGYRVWTGLDGIVMIWIGKCKSTRRVLGAVDYEHHVALVFDSSSTLTSSNYDSVRRSKVKSVRQVGKDSSMITYPSKLLVYRYYAIA